MSRTSYGSTARTVPVNYEGRQLIADSRRVAQETEELGDEVLDSLHHQRGQLENANSKVVDMKTMTKKARMELREMERKAAIPRHLFTPPF
ncbi:unnamed protein product [Phaeothamnion confervicola]